MREPVVLPLDRSPFDLSASADERYERSRAIDHDVVTDEQGLMVAFRRQDDVESMLTDPRFSAIAMPILHFGGVTDGPLHDLWSLLMFGKDGDEHHRLRATVAKPFRPKDVQEHRGAVERFAAELAERMAADGFTDAELWSDFAVPLASRVATHIVGIPEDDADEVGAWAIDLVNGFFMMDASMRDRAERAAVAFLAYLDGHLEAKRISPGDDVTSLLLAGTDPGAETAHDLSPDELRGLVANLVFGGLEATAKAITNGVFHLVTEGQWDALVARPRPRPQRDGRVRVDPYRHRRPARLCAAERPPRRHQQRRRTHPREDTGNHLSRNHGHPTLLHARRSTRRAQSDLRTRRRRRQLLKPSRSD